MAEHRSPSLPGSAIPPSLGRPHAPTNPMLANPMTTVQYSARRRRSRHHHRRCPYPPQPPFPVTTPNTLPSGQRLLQPYSPTTAPPLTTLTSKLSRVAAPLPPCLRHR
ncbi:unnamed protein product [Cuscuta epithymum]|uniref:Uncharacterized protein n=1 Tax=Cuscuta epithymum TaxID=186058 RepID=A0AAV0D1S4_9ASTE|nr:unnamed protein product [Cuscuta epithymum]